MSTDPRRCAYCYAETPGYIEGESGHPMLAPADRSRVFCRSCLAEAGVS